MVKLKKVLKSSKFWKSQAWLGAFVLGITFFVSGKSFFEYLSSLTITEMFWAIAITTGLGLFIELYFKPLFK